MDPCKVQNSRPIPVWPVGGSGFHLGINGGVGSIGTVPTVRVVMAMATRSGWGMHPTPHPRGACHHGPHTGSNVVSEFRQSGWCRNPDTRYMSESRHSPTTAPNGPRRTITGTMYPTCHPHRIAPPRLSSAAERGLANGTTVARFQPDGVPVPNREVTPWNH